MTIIPEIQSFAQDLTEIRRDLHAHPEIGFEEKRTAAIVAAKLKEYGLDEVHEGIGVTGVVGILRGTGGAGRTIGLRADMDALPMEEQTNLPYRSQNPGAFHGCGHDGHTTMLLGAARYLAARRDFAGTAMFVFQPAEEGLGGARAMIAEKLFERFPCDEIYGLHNSPVHDLGQIAVFPGKAMAGASFYFRATTPPEIALRDMYRGVVPFIALHFVVLGLIIAFPAIALWLPSQLLGFD